jgi:hypothetical protein
LLEFLWQTGADDLNPDLIDSGTRPPIPNKARAEHTDTASARLCAGVKPASKNDKANSPSFCTVGTWQPWNGRFAPEAVTGYV